MPEIVKSLAGELKSLVNIVVSILGEVILEESGEKLFSDVETIRKELILYRNSFEEEKNRILSRLFKKLKKCDQKSRHEMAHAYTLMLELINSCEASYRTFRLKDNNRIEHSKRQDNIIIYVLTAHPTETRTSVLSHQMVTTFRPQILT